MRTQEADPLPPRWERSEGNTSDSQDQEPPLPADELWRLEMFERLGIGPDQAALLAYHKADWHEARRLIDQGCSPILAAAILL